MKNYIYILIAALSIASSSLIAESTHNENIPFVEMIDDDEARGLFRDHLQNPLNSYRLEWISDKGDEIILSDGSRWALDTTSLLAAGKDWEIGDRIAFLHKIKKF